MKAHPQYSTQDRTFWANVRTISQQLGYTDRITKQIKTYTIEDIKSAMHHTGLSSEHLIDENNNISFLGNTLVDYFIYRAHVLNEYAKPRLMTLQQAQELFHKLQHDYNPTVPTPMNKQTGDKKKIAFLTAIVNIVIEKHINGLECDYTPKTLTAITKNNQPLRTLARRVDGCFPSCTNPVAIWEIKEYYHTTSFGSRIADGIYETLLDGMELEELWQQEKIDVQHLLVIDSYTTWWEMGKSYLCRIIDTLNMGYVDDILFGYEVVEQLPAIVTEWITTYQSRLNGAL